MHLMFDLDGTLTDSRVGIIRCIQHALAEAGVAAPSSEELTRFVGPPLGESFATLLGTSDAQRIEAAVAAYRHRFGRVGMFENQLYPGIIEMLRAFQAEGLEMSVVTSKPRTYALRILEHFEIVSLFRGVYGPSLEARRYAKETLIREACAGAATRDRRAMMIGDRAEDVNGAKANGVRSAAVMWGYGDREELESARPDWIVASAVELMEHVRDLLRNEVPA